MTELCCCTDAAFPSSVDGFRAIPQLVRLLARGGPLNLDELTGAAGQAGAALAQGVRAQPGTEWDDDGRLVGFALTSRPTDHRFTVGGRVLDMWCASDTLLFTVSCLTACSYARVPARA